ncbi:hypothetical protein Kpol_1043p56 [Vanderwaltozyma polyspora DSM 70294]|uniref:rRNA adenine N(6)-methyltransferase n=1 Tax=Vanderwaltozyma polyspora (strain ATCC 22028 / DSM 70294 / BCRC 21397 / CBS 2163 / NBRC 10782 / NRRL Y-8283 / UCD 57-17) TaxID=436907 RepID=A7TIS4_VANPO|nr:uncharacterized protein Kpol_1043p56 [Vanderwaltozyma polyspora DSM 70294]EDO17866.1 hypothetical protein Kpol_1043p56 [Vanderwaltozyma polyspora DSM 70294]
MSLVVKPYQALSKLKRFYGFKYLLNPLIHEQIFDRLKLEDTYGDFSKVKVIDLYPGPSQHSAIFNNRYKPAKHVLVENRASFLSHIKETYTDSKFGIYDKDPYEWSTYTDMIERHKVLTPEVQSRDKIHDKFLAIAHLTNSSSEGLFMQWLTCIGTGNWIMKYGRVKMLVWLPTATAVKLLAVPGKVGRSKCSICTEAFTDTKLIAYTEGKEVQKFNQDLLKRHNPLEIKNADTAPIVLDSISLLEVNPKKNDIQLEYWDYVTKHLMILKTRKLSEALESLGHGARDYFAANVKDISIFDKFPAELTNEEFIYLTDIFYKWPFKPDIYMDFIDVYQDND